MSATLTEEETSEKHYKMPMQVDKGRFFRIKKLLANIYSLKYDNKFFNKLEKILENKN